jgi:predicted RNase H-like HicB family nuclease
MNKVTYQITVIIEGDEDGFYAYCPQLPGCQSQGETLEQVKVNIQEAIDLYLSTLSETEKQDLLNQEVMNLKVEVAVA